MTGQTSIAARLAIALTFSATMLLLISVGIAATVLRHELNEAFDDTMRQSALRLLPLAVHDIDEMMEGEFEEDEASFVAGLTDENANLDYYILDPGNRILIFSGDRPPSVATTPIPLGFSDQSDGRMFALKDPGTGFGIVVSEKQGLRDNILLESITSLFLPLAALVPILGALVYFVTRAAMSPIWKLGRAISRRHGRNLTPLSLGRQPKELQPIVSEVDNLLSRLQAALNAERSFAAESAHELRTPIAGALAQIQVVQSWIDGPDASKHLVKAEEAMQHLSRLSENLLQLSRLEAGFAMSATKTELNAIIDIVLREPGLARNRDRIVYAPDASARLSANITADAFAIVVRNLTQNALRYSPQGSEIEILLDSDTIRIRNDCKAIDPATLETLPERFVRGSTKQKGTGLGLAMVKTIVADCAGEFALVSPIMGRDRGLEAIVRFTPASGNMHPG